MEVLLNGPSCIILPSVPLEVVHSVFENVIILKREKGLRNRVSRGLWETKVFALCDELDPCFGILILFLILRPFAIANRRNKMLRGLEMLAMMILGELTKRPILLDYL